MKELKKFLIKVINKLGYTISHTNIKVNPNLELYIDKYDTSTLKFKRFYNIGAGGFSHPYWTNIDFYNEWYKDWSSNIGIHYDLMKFEKLPLEDNSAEIVYSSHTIEHINETAIINMLKEAFRILKPGGCIRITAPDINLLYRAYKNKDKYFFLESIKYYSSESVTRKLDINPMSDATLGAIFQYYFSASTSTLTKNSFKKKIYDDELEKIFSEMSYECALDHICSFSEFDYEKTGYHINWANADKVKKMLLEVGFKTAYTSAFGQSNEAILRDVNFFDNTVPEWSFYVEAYK
jgi:ubiquinone/menaquinone biosynthesis C-methylase UbiE